MRNKHHPILKLPSRKEMNLPPGEFSVSVNTNEDVQWYFKFVKFYCNVARPIEETKNHLPSLLRLWFGEQAGEPGTEYFVRFFKESNGWFVEPVEVRGED